MARYSLPNTVLGIGARRSVTASLWFIWMEPTQWATRCLPPGGCRKIIPFQDGRWTWKSFKMDPCWSVTIMRASYTGSRTSADRLQLLRRQRFEPFSARIPCSLPPGAFNRPPSQPTARLFFSVLVITPRYRLNRARRSEAPAPVTGPCCRRSSGPGLLSG